jgi:NADPH:quinone reductase-like Zn-dependent oxidoreductase
MSTNLCRKYVISQKNYCSTPAEILHYSSELFGLIQDGQLNINVHKEYPFTAEGVVEAQKDLTGGKTTGKLVIKIA